MTFKLRLIIAAGAVLAVAAAVGPAHSQPPTVPRLSVRALDQASYVELARQWKEYIEKHGESAFALVNLGMAYSYSGEKDAALAAARRAVEVDPENPKALALFGGLLAKYEGEDDKAIELLTKCRSVAPDDGRALIELSAIYMRRGQLDDSEKIFETIFAQNVIERPFQDFAYNMLVGLPQGAVLITNGDNDTFPPLALQAGKKFRNDVVVINRSLLNDERYEKAVFERYPSVKPRGSLKTDEGLSRASAVIKHMVEDERINVFFASSVSFEGLGFRPDVSVEGVNLRSSKKGKTSEESASLFLETYRMDSATDWSYAWDLFPAASLMVSNYVTCMAQLVYNDKNLNAGTKQKLLTKAMEIAEFHDMDRLISWIESLKKK